jgi:hypothetical protein
MSFAFAALQKIRRAKNRLSRRMQLLNRHSGMWEFLGTVFTIVAGVAMHFAYELSGENFIVGIFAARNESVFEQMKLLFWPFLFWSLIELIVWGRDDERFFRAKGKSLFWGVFIIPVAFYAYSGILGYHMLWADVFIFAAAAGTAFFLGWLVMQRRERRSLPAELFGGVLILALIAFFVITTIYPLPIGLYAIS